MQYSLSLNPLILKAIGFTRLSFNFLLLVALIKCANRDVSPLYPRACTK